MSAENCFDAKIALGRVSKQAGARIKAIIQAAKDADARGDAVGAREAMQKALRIAQHEANARTARTLGNAEAQLAIQREAAQMRGEFDRLAANKQAPLRIPGLTQYQGKASELWLYVQSKLYGDTLLDVGNHWNNVYYLARQLRGEAHAKFTDAIAALRPKLLGLKREAARESDVLAAIHGDVRTPEAGRIATAWGEANEFARTEFNRAAGYEAIPKREGYIPNPTMSPAKVLAWSAEAFIDRVSRLLDRDKMIDFSTGLKMGDAKLRQVLRDVYETGRTGGAEGGPSAGYVGQGPLSDRRSAARTLILKDAASWQSFNELFGTGTGPFDAMMSHLHAMTHDAAMMRVFGPDPAASKRFIESLFEREPARLAVQGIDTDKASMAAAYKANRDTANRVEAGLGKFRDGWSNMTGETGLAVNANLAERMGTIRALLGAAQLGTSVISAISDAGLAASAARMNGLPIMETFGEIVRMFATRSSEISNAQHGLVLDTIAHGAREADVFMDQTIRSNVAAKLSTAVIRSIGHRVWTGKIRDGFAMEFMAKMAAAIENKTPYGDLSFKAALQKYGVDQAAWEQVAAKVQPFQARPGASLLRPMDVRATPGLGRIGEGLGRMIQQELDTTAIEGNPMTRRIVMGSSRPGTTQGEVMRSLALYRSWPVTTFNMLLNRTFARGWDGSRLAHGAFTFIAMTMLGALAMQAKQIVSGRDPKPLDPTTREGLFGWGHAVIQGGGLGVFGDMLGSDKTRQGDSWASMMAGPLANLAEDVGGKFLLANIQRAAEGKPTNFAGEGYWVAARYLPGANVFWFKLAFQRAIIDQLGLMLDPKAPERFQRIEQASQQNYGQGTWWQHGHLTPSRAPNLGAMFGGSP